MKRSTVLIWVATALLVVATAATAAPAPAAQPARADVQSPMNPAPVTLLDSGTCGPPAYSCRACSDMEDLLQLCSVQICGTYVIVSCDPCGPICRLPPS
jgi:hypothetical protein